MSRYVSILSALGLATAALAQYTSNSTAAQFNTTQINNVTHYNLPEYNNLNVAIDTRSLDEIYEAAQKETGPFVVVSGGDAGGQGTPYIEAWEKSFPNIKLSLTVDVSKYLDSLIDRAFYASNETVDVAILQTLGDFQRWKEDDRLLYYKPSNFQDFYDGERDADGAFVPAAIYSFGTFYYDSTKLSADEVPTNYAELLDPKWKGKMIVTYPNDDDAVANLFSIIISRYGFAWFEAFAKQDVQWVRGTATPSIQIVNNIHGVSNINSTSKNTTGRVLTFTTPGYAGPLNSSLLKTSEPLAPEQKMSWAQTAAIFSSTKRPETSRLFISFLTSYALQGNSTPSFLKSVDKGELYLSNITQTSGFRQFENDRTRVAWWQTQFETTLGTAQGPSPLVFYPNPPGLNDY